MLMRSYPFVVPANARARMDVRGTFLKCISSTGAAGAITARVERQGTSKAPGAVLADGLTLNPGDKPKFGEPFDMVTFTNSTGADISLTVVAGAGDHDQNSLVGSVSVSNLVGSTNDSPADVAITAASSLDLAADSTIRERVFQAADANTGDVCIRDQTGTTSAGVRINPARLAMFTWSNSGALRLRNNSGATQNVQILNNRS